MPDPFIIHRDGRVSDRETGEVVGRVERTYYSDPSVAIYLLSEDPALDPIPDYSKTEWRLTRRDAARLLWERWQEQKGGRDG